MNSTVLEYRWEDQAQQNIPLSISMWNQAIWLPKHVAKVSWKQNQGE